MVHWPFQVREQVPMLITEPDFRCWKICGCGVATEARVGFEVRHVDRVNPQKLSKSCVEMDEDYFDDASDADFLALAQQVDPASNGRSNQSNRPTATLSAPGPVSRIPSTEASTGSGLQRPETPKTNSTAPKVLRPGFNAVIVNTRQVTSTSKIVNIIERYTNELLKLNLGNPLLEHIRNVPWEVCPL